MSNNMIEAVKEAAQRAGVRDVFTEGDNPPILQECKDIKMHLNTPHAISADGTAIELDEYFTQLRGRNPALFKPSINYSAMSDGDKSNFIDEHGLDAFNDLMRSGRAGSGNSVLTWTNKQKSDYIGRYGSMSYLEKVREARKQAR